MRTDGTQYEQIRNDEYYLAWKALTKYQTLLFVYDKELQVWYYVATKFAEDFENNTERWQDIHSYLCEHFSLANNE